MVKEREPFSFLNTIFINPSSYDEDTYNHIIEHEKIHIDQSHFFDKIIAEILVIIFWFNPFTWLLRSGISRNLEFLTDQSLIKNGIQKNSYQMSLLKVSVSNQPFNLTMSYNSSFLKNRIDMMNAKKSSIVSSWKYLFIPPLFLLSIFSLNAIDGGQVKKELQKEKTEQISTNTSKENQEKKNWKSNSTKTAESTKSTQVQKVENNKNGDAVGKEITKELNSAFTAPKSNYGAYVRRELGIDPFVKLGLAINGHVELSYGKTQKVTVEGPEHLVDDLLTDVNNGNWNIQYDEYKHSKNLDELKFKIQMKHLEVLAVAGQGTIASTNTFKNLDRLMLSISGNGDIEISAEANDINFAISGNGTGRVDGRTDDLAITISGDGKVNARDLKANTCRITASGSGEMSVDVKEKIKATVSGYAMVKYKGNPTISKKVSGSAKFRKI